LGQLPVNLEVNPTAKNTKAAKILTAKNANHANGFLTAKAPGTPDFQPQISLMNADFISDF
jgi:hypothetical protein